MRLSFCWAGVLALGAIVPAGLSGAAAAQNENREAQVIASKTDWPALGKCEKKQFEWARLSLDVLDDGSKSGVQLVDSSRPAVNAIAMEAVRADRFAPAQRDGMPVSMHGILLVEMDACVSRVKQADGSGAERFWMEAAPKQTFYASPNMFDGPPKPYRVGANISAPVPTMQPKARYTAEAKKAHIQGEVYVALVVDANGMPQNPRVVKPLPAGLTDAALAAVREYRFKPALKDGKTPVPVGVTIAVNFRLY